MSAKSSPKIVKVDLQPQNVQKKSRRKIQGPKKKNSSTQQLQKTFKIDKLQSQSSSKLKDSILIESEVESYKVNEFSFSEQSPNHTRKIQGPGYQIVWNDRPNSMSDRYQKINYMHINLTLKIFELCSKDYEHETISMNDLEVFSKNLNKYFKAIYGPKNQQLIMKKETKLIESLKMVFYRKRQIEASELLFYLFDCGAVDEILTALLQIFPKEIKEF